MRHIWNKIDNDESIKEGYVVNINNCDNYIERYKLYKRNYLDIISNYITFLFENNEITFEKHYKKMLINIMKKIIKIFIFFQKYDCKSMIFFILELFLEKTGNIPIVQNVLINSKETSSEEIEAFFHRAILCSYNTLFVVGISDSFSNSQLNIIYDYTKKTIDKIKTKDYLDSCIIFIYDQKITNTSFLEKLQINFTEIPNVSSKNSLI